MSSSDPAAAAEPGSAVALARDRLIALLNSGAHPPGSRLPGERRLAADTGVSRSSLRQALGLLQREGRLDASPQRGWFVRTGVVSEPAGALASFTEIARARGLTPTARVLDQLVRRADFDEAERLRIAPAAQVVQLVRVRGLDGLPVCVETSVLPDARVPGLAAADLTDRSLFDAVEELSGLQVARSHYVARARAATDREAELLDVSPGEPVLACEEVTVDQAGVPVLLGRSCYRGDAYRFESILYRGRP